MSYGQVLFGFRREPWIAILLISDIVVATSTDSDLYFAVAAYLTSLNVQWFVEFHVILDEEYVHGIYV